MTPVRTAARAMLAGIFVSSGFKALTNPDPLVKKAEPVTHRVAPALTRVHEKLPTDPRTLVQVNGAVQVAAGLLLPSRLHRVAALALIGSIIPTTAAGHRFWELDDPGERAQQKIHFMKNLARRPAPRGDRHRRPTRPAVARRAPGRAHKPCSTPQRQEGTVGRGIR